MALVGVDWGTTSLRAYLIHTPGVVVETLEEAGAGALAIAAHGAHGFAETLESLLARGESEEWRSSTTPVILCGMVGSRLGWQEVPYCCSPASLVDALVATQAVQLVDGREALIVPGLSHQSDAGVAPDVMRGEETQLFGAVNAEGGEGLFVLPGTHSKWAYASLGGITAFQTQMTGEVFELLQQHSILGKLMEPAQEDWVAFDTGLTRSAMPGGVLGHIFACRTEGLAGGFAPASLASFLSGILIGHELRESGKAGWSWSGGVTIVGNELLCERYRRAFAVVSGVASKVVLGKDAIAMGLWRIRQVMQQQRSAAELKSQWSRALAECPVVAILRGVTPPEVVAVGEALVEVGIRIIEVPMNSPNALESIRLLAENLPDGVVIGAGTVLTVQDVLRVAKVGGKLIVSPNADEEVIKSAKGAGLICYPGVCTPTEAFSALKWGADGVKAFPCEALPPKVLKAWRAVLPKDTSLIAVGGICTDNMQSYWDIGVNGYGFGSNLYSPGTKPEDVKAKAIALISQCRSQKAKRVGGA